MVANIRGNPHNERQDGMQISDFLQENGEIHDRWLDRVIATYPEGGGAAIKQQKDSIANPLGYNIRHAVTLMYKHFCDTVELDKALVALEDLIRIRAVQEFTPAEAVSFAFLFKDAIKEENSNKKEDEALGFAEWLDFEKRIDAIALQTFDMYMANRERVFKVRINEMKRGTDNLVCPSAMMRREENKQ
ncbi:MAG: RsbRD N-terminal domain-containing protein, partial [Desulfobulbaceae bacterium]|nr:RsbRD N-terminal domain-containing protein [Desulfobulbaceae bacterium]